MQISSYVHSHAVTDDVVGLYLPFGHEVTFLPNDDWERARGGRLGEMPTPVASDLVRRGFVSTPERDRAALDALAVPPVRGFASLFLVTTQRCNMRCGYCVVSASSSSSGAPEQRMSAAVASAALDLFARSLAQHGPPAAKVTFYGGEPILAREVLEAVIPTVRRLHYQGQRQPIEILCFTNGLTFDPELAALFRAHDVAVGVSLDGKREHHDRARRDLGGGGTFDRVVESVRGYQERGIRVGLSCTIGSHNHQDLPAIAQWFLEELRPLSVQLQTPILTADGSNPFHVEMRIAARYALGAFNVLRAVGVEEGLAMRRIHPFTHSRFHHRDCLAVGGELAVLPDGRIGPCHNAVPTAGDRFASNVLDPACDPGRLPIFNEWHARAPVNMQRCRDCSFIALCGGGCPYNALLAAGSIWEIDPQQCGYMEELIDWLLEDVWKRYQRLSQPGSNPREHCNGD